LLGLLPAVLQDDPVVAGLTEGLDDVLAPVFASLNCLDAYLDPWLAPEDFLADLAEWVGVLLGDDWPVPRRRDAVAHAVELHRCRGTAWGLQWQLDLMTDGRAEVVDCGGAHWSRTPTDTVPPGGSDELVVRVRGTGGSAEELAAIGDIVAWAKPAHVPHRMEAVAE
jgi:phage tail-like protein